MKNVKFGMFCLGLAGLVGTAVSTLDAQTWTVQAEPGRRVQVERPDVMMLDGRGAQLGVMVSDLDTKATTGGVKIDDVNPDSPAEKAGIKAGDVVVEYDGERVRSARQFTRLVQETPEGRSVAIALLRDGKRQTVNATPETSRMTWNFGPEVDRAMREAERSLRNFRLDEPREFRFDDREPRRFEYRLPERALPFRIQPRGRLGVTVQSLTRDLEEYFGAKNGGALVSSVTPDSAASKAGVKAGDVIVSINGRSVRDSDDLLRELEDFTGDATIVVLRDKKEMTLKAAIENPRPAAPRAGSRPGEIL
jgi:C-terminal processing protease CtpA/Prc